MKRTWIYILALAIALPACSWFKKVPEDAPPFTRKKKLLQEVLAQENQFERVRLSGKGHYQGSDQSMSFRFDIRLYRDSIVWIDVGDPFLGLKVARARVYPNRVQFYNKLNKQYYDGDLGALQERIGFSASFRMLMGALAGNLVIPPEENLELQYLPGKYLLTNYQIKESSLPSQTIFHEYHIDPKTHKATLQKRLEPSAGQTFTLSTTNYQNKKGQLWPHKIKFEYRSQETTTLHFEIKSIDVDGDFGFPFSIPSRYAPM